MRLGEPLLILVSFGVDAFCAGGNLIKENNVSNICCAVILQ